MSRPVLMARDAKTFRRVPIVFASGWDLDTNPEALARYLVELVGSAHRTWLYRYGVALPRRVEWSIVWVEHHVQLGRSA